MSDTNLRQFDGSPNLVSQNFIDFLTVANLASGGSIGTAPNTVDQYQGAIVTQTTASQAITIPIPTGNCPKMFWVVNGGTTSFTIDGVTIFVGQCIGFLFSGISVPNQGFIWSAMNAGVSLTTTTSTTTTTTSA